MKSIRLKVRHWLAQYPTTRENDGLLLANIWLHTLPTRLKTDEVLEVLDMIQKGKLPKPYLIERERRILQARHPELRGDNYDHRQKHCAKYIKAKGDSEKV